MSDEGKKPEKNVSEDGKEEPDEQPAAEEPAEKELNKKPRFLAEHLRKPPKDQSTLHGFYPSAAGENVKQTDPDQAQLTADADPVLALAIADESGLSTFLSTA